MNKLIINHLQETEIDNAMLWVEIPCLWVSSLEIGVFYVTGMSITCIVQTTGVGPVPRMKPTTFGTELYVLFQILASVLNAIMTIHYM
jgi:hypothetical protein